MHDVRSRFTFPTDFSQNLMWNIITQRCINQSQKSLRLRSEMGFLRTSLIPFRVNPQSCPYINTMQPTNPNAHTYVNGTDVETHIFSADSIRHLLRTICFKMWELFVRYWCRHANMNMQFLHGAFVCLTFRACDNSIQLWECCLGSSSPEAR